MLFYYSLAAAFLALTFAFYRYRATILPHIHIPERIRTLFPKLSHYTPLSTFSEQVNAGMTSSQFDIEANLRDGDSRAGLDERGTQEVMEIMRQQRVNFDQARLIRHNRILARNGIDPSGMPLDSKAVTRL
ncbi:putative fungal protein of unknown function (DUF2015) [Lyophyllum shimeji]|uniref:Uncharacterized protein n=1 Tax=Lyophyllum shimeji TaxID=47721 RepID=A0A9P3PUV8_LYOSH|nr:putative fungal protein of unknown function (DUF2015) [Lyophyllum shimeji]